MNKVLTVVVLLLVVSAASAQDVKYFPNRAFDDDPKNDNFVVQWYTKNLKALHEPSLLEQAATGKQVYRFLWLRTFHNPVAVRLNLNSDGTALLTVKVTSGKGGYQPGTLTKNTTRKLSKQETDWFLARVQELDYWKLPTRAPKTDEIGTDGAQWIVEAIKDGTYKVVDRWSPEKGAVHSLGTIMLFDLAKLELPYRDVY